MNARTALDVQRLASEVTRLCREYRQELADNGSEWGTTASPKLTGELRRRSMDLTRALAEMRKS